MSDDAKLRQESNIAWLANYIARDPELDKHGDSIFVRAWAQTKDRYTETEFTLAVVRLIRTLREMIRLDGLRIAIHLRAAS